MLDIRFIRSNPKAVEDNLRRRHDPEKIKLLKEVIKSDKDWREAVKKIEAARRHKNLVTKQISEKKDEKTIKEMKKINKELKEFETKRNELKEEIHQKLMQIPNMLHDSVPFGKDDNDNKEIRKWGKPPKFSFKPKDHLEISKNLGIIDDEHGAKVSGHGFFYLKKELVLLDYALLRYATEFMIKNGFTLVEPPFLMRKKPYEGVIQLEDFKNVLYKIENEDLYLIATSEHPVAAMLMDEVINMKDLPIKIVGISPCFRREVGAHGKYTRGLFRMHQFNKVEQFIFCEPEDSWKLFEEIQKNTEDILQSLGLPYRVMNVCTGDIGDMASKKYDTDVWMADGTFREIGSNSNCTDYQARRLNIRFREKEGMPPLGFVHTLNNTALATSRAMLAILENNQKKDGSVDIPEVLWPYMNGIKSIKKN